MNAMVQPLAWVIVLALGCPCARAELVLATNTQTKFVVVSAADATPPERFAARELAAHLQIITGAKFAVVTNDSPSLPEQAIIVGGGKAVLRYFPAAGPGDLAAEEFVIQTQGQRLLLAGGRPRGTLYAVYRFLQEQCGVRWWTPWATNIPHLTTLRIPELAVRSQPAFEYREPFWFSGFDPLWKVRNGVNGANAGSRQFSTEEGGGITYVGFAHTFYRLVPPEEYFASHPEWFSLIKGKRTHEHAQLCLSNPELRDFVVQRVKARLRRSPDARIVSVTQNDWHGACECADCQAIDQAEGSQAGSVIAFVNYVAEKIEPDFPEVAVDTFAYQYTRRPPRTLRPRTNVIVRLCSIECNFREPLDHPSNAAFYSDLEGWAKICHRLYIWDYTTDFQNYLLPHPNWFTLGRNVRLFQQFGVRGVFEQGAYQDWGGEMGELRAWVLARLLSNPAQDDRALIREFLEGYYGAASARPIGRYLELLHEASKGCYLRCYTSRTNEAHRSFKVLSEAERLWQEAEAGASQHPEFLERVRLGHLAVRYAFLRDWKNLRAECEAQHGSWPFADSPREVALQFEDVSQGIPSQAWTHVKQLNEAGTQVDDFLRPLIESTSSDKTPPR